VKRAQGVGVFADVLVQPENTILCDLLLNFKSLCHPRAVGRLRQTFGEEKL
jgi:hypothetical protein